MRSRIGSEKLALHVVAIRSLVLYRKDMADARLGITRALRCKQNCVISFESSLARCRSQELKTTSVDTMRLTRSWASIYLGCTKLF